MIWAHVILFFQILINLLSYDFAVDPCFIFQTLIKAHVHHYLQVPGFNEEDFTSSLETLLEVEEGYTKLTKIKGKSVPRLQVL